MTVPAFMSGLEELCGLSETGGRVVLSVHEIAVQLRAEFVYLRGAFDVGFENDRRAGGVEPAIDVRLDGLRKRDDLGILFICGRFGEDRARGCDIRRAEVSNFRHRIFSLWGNCGRIPTKGSGLAK